MGSKYCDNCCYRKTFVSGSIPYCDYICMTGHRRPCPPGEGCTVKTSRSVYRKRQRTEEEKEAFIKKQREKNRKKCNAYYQRHKDKINAKAREKRLAKCGG